MPEDQTSKEAGEINLNALNLRGAVNNSTHIYAILFLCYKMNMSPQLSSDIGRWLGDVAAFDKEHHIEDQHNRRAMTNVTDLWE